jgi:uncharacterized protein involved in outer membrane biogenesis
VRRRAWWGRAVAAVVVLPVAAVGAAAVLLDPNDYKQTLVDAVQDATGRELSLNGPVRLSRSLWPTVEINDVTLANLPGGTRPDMARAERIEAQLSLPALFRRRIEVARLTLVGPNILFEQVGGKPNWVFDPPGRASDAPLAAAPGTPFQLRIRTAHVQNGMVTWRLPARTKVVGIRALDLRHHTDEGPLEVGAVLVYSDNQSFTLRASAMPTAGITGPWDTRLDFAAFDAAAVATGMMDVAGHYDLQVEAKAGELSRLNALLPDMRLPTMHNAIVSAHVTNGPVPGDLPVVGATRLRFADADFGHRAPGLKLGATEVSLERAGGLATVSGAGWFAGQPFTMAGTVGVPTHPDGRASLPIGLKFHGAPAGGKAASGSLALTGKLALHALGFDGLDATAVLRTPSLAALRPVLAQGLPALTGVEFEGHLAIPASAAFVRFKDARLQSNEGDVAGEGTLGLGAARVLDARLHSSTLDMDAMLEAFGVRLAMPVAPAGGTGPVIPDTPLPWALLRGPTLDVTGSIGAMTFQNEVWRAVELALRIKGGRMQVGSVKLAMPSGPAAVSMTADASTSPVPVSLAVHAPGIPLALLARYAGLPGQVSGTARIEANLRGTGRTVRGLAASLDGPVSVTAVGGQMSNAALIKLASASLDVLGIKVPAQGETALRCLGVAGSFSNGVARLRTIALETTYLSLQGAGQVDLGRETVAVRLNPLAQVSGSPVSVPVVVEGPFHAIAGRLDADAFHKLGLLFDAWFGGDRQTACADAGLVPGRAPGR